MKDRVPPSNVDAEESLLGSLMIDTEAIRDIGTMLEPLDFYREVNRWIYESMLALAEARVPVDLVTLTDDLRKRERLEPMGGESYVIGLINTVPTSINAEAYARIIKDCSTRRKMISAAMTTANMAFDEDQDLDAQVNYAEKAIVSLRSNDEIQAVKDGMVIASNYLEYLYMVREGKAMGNETGYREYDAFTGGLASPFMHVLAARPGLGKSSWAVGVADHAALTLGQSVLTFSLEMTSDQLVQRIVAKRTGINIYRLRAGKLSEQEWSLVNNVVGMISQSRLFIDETPDLTPEQARVRASRIQDKHGLDLIIYDHLHLMRSTSYVGNPNKEVGDVSKKVSYTSKELGVASVLAAQLNRGVEDRKDKRPTLRDLRDSGEIEQNSYSVTFLYRTDYYEPIGSDRIQIAEQIIAKNRDGALGTTELMWTPKTASFSNIVRSVIA